MRKIIQIAFQLDISSNNNSETGGVSEIWNGSKLHALCDDGTIWYLRNDVWHLWELPQIPQGEIKVGELPTI